MPKPHDHAEVKLADVMQALAHTEEEYHVTLRLSLQAREVKNKPDACYIYITPYKKTGGLLREVDRCQLLWPSSGFRTLTGAMLALCYEVDKALFEWHEAELARIRAEREIAEGPQWLPTLEEYFRS